jgi:hypothetical protein
MRSLFAVTFAFAAITAIACGGKYDGGNPDGGSCSSTESCSTDGTTCSFQATICNKPETVTCMCSQGMWACPDYGGACPVEACPMDTSPGMPCATNGLQCPAMMMGCDNQPITCTCDGSQFQCPIPDCPVQMCPPPDQIVPNTGCMAPGNDLCPGPNGSECTCMGTWQCSFPVDAGAPDASVD